MNRNPIAATLRTAQRAARPAASDNMKAELVALKKERILEAATQLFLKCGYHGCSMDAIAQAIGVTKPFIYYQFRDKGEILAAICSEGADLSLLALDEAEAQASSAAARMRWFCKRLTEVVVDRGHFLAVYLRETANLSDADRKKILHKRAQIDKRVSALIASGVECGEFSVANPEIAARAITGMISNSFQWQRKDAPPGRDEFVRIMTAIAMRTLLAETPSPSPSPSTSPSRRARRSA